jgi:hypothetical protein
LENTDTVSSRCNRALTFQSFWQAGEVRELRKQVIALQVQVNNKDAALNNKDAALRVAHEVSFQGLRDRRSLSKPLEVF